MMTYSMLKTAKFHHPFMFELLNKIILIRATFQVTHFADSKA